MDTKIIPVIRWIGSKKRIIKDIIKHVPIKYKNYYEPFLGSGVVFLNIKYNTNTKIYLNDINKDIINLYKCIKNNPNDLIELLEKYRKSYEKSSNKKNQFFVM